MISSSRFASLACKNLGKHDIATRAWAAHEPSVALIVRKVDRLRLRFAKKLFPELGFRGLELDTPTRVYVTFVSLETGILQREPRRNRLRELDRRIDFFTRP